MVTQDLEETEWVWLFKGLADIILLCRDHQVNVERLVMLEPQELR